MSQKSENIEPVSLNKLGKRERAKALLLLNNADMVQGRRDGQWQGQEVPTA